MSLCTSYDSELKKVEEVHSAQLAAAEDQYRQLAQAREVASTAAAEAAAKQVEKITII
jgi:hypothetical protein